MASFYASCPACQGKVKTLNPNESVRQCDPCKRAEGEKISATIAERRKKEKKDE